MELAKTSLQQQQPQHGEGSVAIVDANKRQSILAALRAGNYGGTRPSESFLNPPTGRRSGSIFRRDRSTLSQYAGYKAPSEEGEDEDEEEEESLSSRFFCIRCLQGAWRFFAPGGTPIILLTFTLLLLIGLGIREFTYRRKSAWETLAFYYALVLACLLGWLFVRVTWVHLLGPRLCKEGRIFSSLLAVLDPQLCYLSWAGTTFLMMTFLFQSVRFDDSLVDNVGAVEAFSLAARQEYRDSRHVRVKVAMPTGMDNIIRIVGVMSSNSAAVGDDDEFRRDRYARFADGEAAAISSVEDRVVIGGGASLDLRCIDTGLILFCVEQRERAALQYIEVLCVLWTFRNVLVNIAMFYFLMGLSMSFNGHLVAYLTKYSLLRRLQANWIRLVPRRAPGGAIGAEYEEQQPLLTEDPGDAAPKALRGQVSEGARNAVNALQRLTSNVVVDTQAREKQNLVIERQPHKLPRVLLPKSIAATQTSSLANLTAIQYCKVYTPGLYVAGKRYELTNKKMARVVGCKMFEELVALRNQYASDVFGRANLAPEEQQAISTEEQDAVVAAAIQIEDAQQRVLIHVTPSQENLVAALEDTVPTGKKFTCTATVDEDLATGCIENNNDPTLEFLQRSGRECAPPADVSSGHRESRHRQQLEQQTMETTSEARRASIGPLTRLTSILTHAGNKQIPLALTLENLQGAVSVSDSSSETSDYELTGETMRALPLQPDKIETTRHDHTESHSAQEPASSMSFAPRRAATIATTQPKECVSPGDYERDASWIPPLASEDFPTYRVEQSFQSEVELKAHFTAPIHASQAKPPTLVGSDELRAIARIHDSFPLQTPMDNTDDSDNGEEDSADDGRSLFSNGSRVTLDEDLSLKDKADDTNRSSILWRRAEEHGASYLRKHLPRPQLEPQQNIRSAGDKLAGGMQREERNDSSFALPSTAVVEEPYITKALLEVFLGDKTDEFLREADNGGRDRVYRKQLSRMTVSIYKLRKQLLSIVSSQVAIQENFRRLLTILLTVIGVFIILILAGVAVNTIIVSGAAVISAVTVSLSFFYSNFIQSVVFVCFLNPYNVGDRCRILGEIMTVKKVDTFFTEFSDANNKPVIYTHSYLYTIKIVNESRSKRACIDFTVYISDQTPPAVFHRLKKEIRAFTDNRPEFVKDSAFFVLNEIALGHYLKFTVWVTVLDSWHHYKSVHTSRALLWQLILRQCRIFGIEYKLPIQRLDGSWSNDVRHHPSSPTHLAATGLCAPPPGQVAAENAYFRHPPAAGSVQSNLPTPNVLAASGCPPGARWMS